MQIGELQVVNEQLEQENIKLWEEIRLLKDQVSYLTHQCNLSSQSAIVAQQQMLSVQTTQQERPEISVLSLKGDDKKVCFYTGLPNYNVLEVLYRLLEPCTSSKRGQEEQNLIIR